MSPGVLAPPHELLTPDDWHRRGRDARKLAARSSHAQWDPPADRPDPVAILQEQARTRVPDLVPIRYGRMVASSFAYFRGAAAPMAWDLAHTPTSGMRVQACGDAHLLNFGMFAAPDRRLVFDVNDFDETLPAPFEWDVKRLAASFAVAARDKEFCDRDAHAAARAAVRSYRTEMANYAGDALPQGLVLQDRRRRGDQAVRRAPAQGGRAAAPARHRGRAPPDEPEGVPEDVRSGRGAVPDPARPSGDRPVPDRAPSGDPGGIAPRHRALPGDDAGRPLRGPEPLLLRGLRAQGGRRRLGRHRGVRPAAARRPAGRAAVPAAEGGAGVSPGPVRREERVQAPGRAGGAGPAADAGRQRPVPRLDDRHRNDRVELRRPAARAIQGVLRPAAARHEGQHERLR